VGMLGDYNQEMSGPLLYESHCHTPLCKHASGLPGEYAAAAYANGLKGLIVTCHCPLPDGISAPVRMRPDQFHEYVAMVDAARLAWKGRIDVRLGMESDYYPGVEKWLEKLHAEADFHHILGSVHYHVPEYRSRYFTGNIFDYQKLYYEHLAMSAETGLYDTLAHPDLIKNEDPDAWEFERLRPFVEKALDRIAACGTAMELNTSGRNKLCPEMNPGFSQLVLMRERNIPVVLGADAHTPDRVGDHYLEALDHLELAGYSEVSFFLERTRRSVSIEDARNSLLHEPAEY